jgi:hypothetical protein
MIVLSANPFESMSCLPAMMIVLWAAPFSMTSTAVSEPAAVLEVTSLIIVPKVSPPLTLKNPDVKYVLLAVPPLTSIAPPAKSMWSTVPPLRTRIESP